MEEVPCRLDKVICLNAKWYEKVAAMKFHEAGRSDITDFLALWVLNKRLDEKTALRIELVRRARQIDPSVNGDFKPAIARSVVRKELAFDSFVVDLNNVLAVEMAKEVVEEADWSQTYNPLCLYCERSVGKTHLLTAIANAVRPLEALLVNMSLLLDEYDRTNTLNAKMGLRKWLVSGDLLLLDDIQVCAGRKDLQMEVVSAIAHAISQHRSVVVTSDVPPKSLTDVDQLLVSLLTSGELVHVGMCKNAVTPKLVKPIDKRRPFAPDNPQNGTEQHFANPAASRRTDSPPGKGLPAAVASAFSGESGAHSSDSQEIMLDPEGDAPASIHSSAVPTQETSSRNGAEDFKRMVALAESEEEEVKAIQSAIAERIRQLSQSGADPEQLDKLREAAVLVKNGKLWEAMARMAR